MRFAFLLASYCCLTTSIADAGVTSQAAETIVRKATGQTARTASVQAAKQLAKKGAIEAAEEAAEVAARRGSEMAARQFSQTIATSPGFVDDLGKTLARMTPRNQRRLLTLAPELEKSGQAASVVTHLASGQGDELIETLWRHRGKLAAAGTVATLLVHGDAVVAATGEYVAKPLIDGTMQHVAEPLVTGTMEHIAAPAAPILAGGVVLAGLIAFCAFLVSGPPSTRIKRFVARLVRGASRWRSRF